MEYFKSKTMKILLSIAGTSIAGSFLYLLITKNKNNEAIIEYKNKILSKEEVFHRSSHIEVNQYNLIVYFKHQTIRSK